MSPERPLDRFPLIRTTSVEEMREALAHIYAKPVFEPDKNVKVLNASANHYEIGAVGLHYNRYGAAVDVDFPEAKYFLQIFSIGGKGEAAIGSNSIPIVPGTSAVISADVGYRARWDADFERLVLKIRSDALTSKLAAITGATIGRPLEMDPRCDLALPALQFLYGNFRFLVDLVSTSATPPPNLVLTEFEQMLMIGFLGANEHNYSHLLRQDPPGVASWQVRRAEEHIEANWNRPLDLEGLAAAVGVSTRSLFRAFQRSRSYSPATFAKRLRLQHAKRLLESADPASTVTGIAYQCGFHDLSCFSRDYVRTFGERPSDALKRGKSLGSARH